MHRGTLLQTKEGTSIYVKHDPLSVVKEAKNCPTKCTP